MERHVLICQRVQSLKKKFYFHFQDYVDLIIWKVNYATEVSFVEQKSACAQLL